MILSRVYKKFVRWHHNCVANFKQAVLCVTYQARVSLAAQVADREVLGQ